MQLSIDLLEGFSPDLKTENGLRLVRDVVRRKWIQLTPEEYVRQALLHYFIHRMHYPAALIAVEKQIRYGSLNKRYDIVVYNREHQPWLLAECKAPGIPLQQNTLHQLLQYHSSIPCPYWLLSNGVESCCADAGDIHHISWMDTLPAFVM
ncbi:MAG TPA: type I restriction enzyme HsdR N-terminal domain-containing protein [Chitinophagaceae bacterium]|nr:type I restriction enzyme HsdR N-terminal domain-containing protein [Chitinophagaceae bacterium]